MCFANYSSNKGRVNILQSLKNFKMVALKELKKQIIRCRRCRLSQTRKNALPGEGKPSSRLILIAQAPGEVEDRQGKMFIGPSGKKLDELLRNAGIDRGNIYMTNLIKCMLPGYRKPKQDEIKACSRYLDKELAVINPDIIATLGYYPTRYIFEKCDLAVAEAKSGFSKFYGRISSAQGKKIIALQHPATLLYDNTVKPEMIKNYKKLKVLLADCKWFPVCPIKEFYEQGRIDKSWIELYCKGDWESCVRYYMEENGQPHPDWMLPDGTLDERLR